MIDPLEELEIVPFSEDRIENRSSSGSVSWQLYHRVRNEIVRACREYGPTGPMGIIRIDPKVKNPYNMLIKDPSSWGPGDPDPDYFVLDNQFNDEDQYCYLEILRPEAFHRDWLRSMMLALEPFEGWGIGVGNIFDSYLLIFENELLVKGELARCQSVNQIIDISRELIRR